MASPQEQIAHVWRRLGFGPRPGDVEAWVSAGPTALIDHLFALPASTETDWQLPAADNWEAYEAFHDRTLWLSAYQANQLQERLTWILEGLLVVASRDTTDHREFKKHQEMLRGGCFNTYRQLLHDVTVGAPMQIYLDGVFSDKNSPNLNLARELMELFSIGVVHPISNQPNYTEQDIAEMARALTGYDWNWDTHDVWFDPSRWDPGTKSFLGQDRGIAGVPEVLNAIHDHDAFRYYIPRRLYRELIGSNPSPAVLGELAAVWGADGDIKGLLRHIAGRPEFLADATIRLHVKCPLELFVSTLRVVGIDDLSGLYLRWKLSLLAQERFDTPNVGGWPQGLAWMHSGHYVRWTQEVQHLCWQDSGASDVPVGKQSATIRQLAAYGQSADPTDKALQLAGLFDVSTQTRNAIRNYATGGSWSHWRACGTMNLVVLSPEFLLR